MPPLGQQHADEAHNVQAGLLGGPPVDRAEDPVGRRVFPAVDFHVPADQFSLGAQTRTDLAEQFLDRRAREIRVARNGRHHRPPMRWVRFNSATYLV
jgi:hypothetical protein